MSHLGKGHPRVGAVCPSNASDLAMCGCHGGTRSRPASVLAAGTAITSPPRSGRPSPGAATRPGDLDLLTVERFKKLQEKATSCVASSRPGPSGKATMPSHQVFRTKRLTEASGSGTLRGLGRPLSRNHGVWPALPCPLAPPGSSRSWSTDRATPTLAAGRNCLAGPASTRIIGLGLSGSAGRRGTGRLCSTTTFAGQFPRSAMVSTKTTREEEERGF